MKEREINLVDLMVEVLLHWRGIILLMLLGGICFGGISYIQSFRTAEAKKAQIQEEQEQKERERKERRELEQELRQEFEDAEDPEAFFHERMTETQITNVKAAILYEEICRDRIAYGDNSIIMKFDPYKVSKAQMIFYVKSDDLEHAYNIEKVYESLVSGINLYEYLDAECGIEASSAGEIVQLEYGTLGKDVPADTFMLTVVHYKENQCRKLAQAVVDYVKEWEQELQRELGEHAVIVLSQSVATVADANILNRQRTNLNDIQANMSAAARLKDGFTDEERRYYEYLVEGQFSEKAESEEGEVDKVENDGEEEELFTTIATPSISIKYIMLGVILVAFVYVFIIFLRYILDNKIKYADDLQELYELPQLGKIPRAKTRKSLGVVDEWFCSLRDRDKRKFTLEEATNLAVVAVKIAAKESGLKAISLIGCDMKERTVAVCGQIKAVLEKEGVKVDILNNALYDAENMEKLSDAQGAVLVETAGSTLYEEISRELDMMQRQNIAILGGIVLE